jgi:hypothetical protein
MPIQVLIALSDTIKINYVKVSLFKYKLAAIYICLEYVYIHLPRLI